MAGAAAGRYRRAMRNQCAPDRRLDRSRPVDFGCCAECGRPLSFLRALAHPGSCLCHHCEQALVDAGQHAQRAV
jgi:RNA polymerase-binding transcription factor DksA